MKILSFDVGTINMSFCIYEPQTHTVVEWELLNVRCTTDVCLNLVQTLKEWDDQFRDVQIVLIERQSKRSCKLQHMQSYLEMYFTLMCKQVVIYSPVFKLLGTGMECKGKSNYTQRKKAAIHLATDFLKDHPQEPRHHRMFATIKKKDDAADSLMQVLAYCKIPDPQKLLNPVKPILPRKPTDKQFIKGKMTKNNIKWLLIHKYIPLTTTIVYLEDTPLSQQLQRCMEGDKKLMASVNRMFTGAPACIKALADLPQEGPPDLQLETSAASGSETNAIE